MSGGDFRFWLIRTGEGRHEGKCSPLKVTALPAFVLFLPCVLGLSGGSVLQAALWQVGAQVLVGAEV